MRSGERVRATTNMSEWGGGGTVRNQRHALRVERTTDRQQDGMPTVHVAATAFTYPDTLESPTDEHE